MENYMVNSFDQEKLYLQKDGLEGARSIAVIVHGLCEHQGRYDYLVEKFNKDKIGTYRFDHRGHGRSEGERSFYSDFNEIVDDVNVIVDMAIAENPDIPVFLLGHSMGGFAVALFGAKYPDKKLRGIITSGALTKDNAAIISSVPKGLDVHTQLPNALGASVCSVKEVVEWYELDPYNTKTFTTGLFYSIADGVDWFADKAKDFAYPVLMMHAEKDSIVSVKDTYDLFNDVSSTDKQMKIYGNLLHEIFNEYCKDEVISDASRWILNRI